MRTVPVAGLPPAGRARRAVFRPLVTTVNGCKTAVVLGALGGLLVLVGSLFGQLGALVGLVLGAVVAMGAWWFSDRVALTAARAVPAPRHAYPTYHRVVRELCAGAGLPMPRLYVTPDLQPNAFATGRDPDHAAVAVTEGLVPMAVEPAQAAKYLVHPLTGRRVSFAGLFDTHPPVAERVARLLSASWR